MNEHYFRNCLEKDFQIGQGKKKIEFGLPCGTAGGRGGGSLKEGVINIFRNCFPY